MNPIPALNLRSTVIDLDVLAGFENHLNAEAEVEAGAKEEVPARNTRGEDGQLKAQVIVRVQVDLPLGVKIRKIRRRVRTKQNM